MWGTHTCRQVCCVLSVSWVVDGGEGTCPSWLGGRACELGLVGRGALQTQRVLLDPAALAPRAQLPRKKSLAQHTEARPPAAGRRRGPWREGHAPLWLAPKRAFHSPGSRRPGAGRDKAGPWPGHTGHRPWFPTSGPGTAGQFSATV